MKCLSGLGLTDFRVKKKIMKLKSLKLLGLFLLIGMSAMAQQTVSGKVLDAETGDAVVFARINVDGVGKAKTGFEGEFTVKLKPGTYVFTAIKQDEGYVDKNVEVTVVKDKDLDIVIRIGKSSDVQQLQQAEVVYVRTTGTAKTDEEADAKRDSGSGTQEELSGEAIKRAGPSTAVGAVQMVPGASVQDGKNVFIRGLGDRYTKTILNGMEIPGLDPDRNTVQMDIFPAVLIDNISVFKSFTPNLTGDFTGGLINIQTIDFPSKKTLHVKAGFGYNTLATFNPNYISYDGGKYDFLGFDDGGRQLELNPYLSVPNPVLGENTTYLMTKQFSQTMATKEAMSFLNQRYSFALGNQKKFTSKKDTTESWRYGYNVVLNYRNTNTFFDNVEYNEYLRDTDLSETALFRDRTSRGSLATNDVMWTGLIGQSIKVKDSKISLVLFHTQNGTSTAADLVETNYDSNQAVLAKQGLQYTQRSISNANLSGMHYLDTLKKHKWKMNWAVSPTYSMISDPDIRSTALEISEVPGPNGEDIYLLEESVGAEIRRIFRDLREYNVSGKMDFEYKYLRGKKDTVESKVTFGALNTYKNRSFDVSEYVFRRYGVTTVVPNDPDWFFEDANLWTPQSDSGTYAIGQQEMANIYDANQNITSAYIMHDLPLDSSFSINYGVRFERNVNRYTGQNNTGTIFYNNDVVLDTFNLLPSVNMVYRIKKKAKDSVHYPTKTNFRAAYTQTVARPSFREISISQIFDPIQGRRYLGNINLKQTQIHNVDVRWEHFFGRTELVSASAFYKRFINPIEVVANVAAPNEFMPVNAGQADVYGAEFEIRRAIGFKDNDSVSLILGTNFAYIVSLIDMNKVETVIGNQTFTEKEVREANARVGETIGDFRPMYGQSPYVVNAFINFRNEKLGFQCNLTYNVQGKKLAVIGIGGLPDVYEQPFHSLNMKVSKTFGKIHNTGKDKHGNKLEEKTPRWKASIKGTNLLMNKRQRFYEAFEADPQIFDIFDQGMTFTMSIAYTIQ
jgi:TonB-dependent receptor